MTAKSTPGDAELIEGLTVHVVRHLGEPRVFHELVSEIVHIDVLHAPPTDELPVHTLMTCGMSERPMAAPAELPEARYAEVMLRLPPDWPLDDEARQDESNYWPLRLVKSLALLPHQHETWLGIGHTVANGDPPEPYAPDTELCGAMLLPPLLGPDGFDSATVAGRDITVLAAIPRHADELELKLENGADELIARLADAELSELIDPARPSVLSKRRGWRSAP